MIKKIFFLIISLPFVLVTSIRNFLYDFKLFSSSEFNIPVISVGNLVLGGSGKTPTIEYLIRLLSDKYKVAVLSRGYGRKSNGFIIADSNSDPSLIGDEPMQYYRKFNNIIVCVDSNRVRAINKLINSNLKPEVILLDDAYQHRKVKPKLSILLSEYSKLYSKDYVFPLGNLRESRGSANRADIIMVTKCDKNLNKNDKINIVKKLNLNNKQSIYFSYIEYSNMVYGEEGKKALSEFKNKNFTLVTGIADPSNMVNYLKNSGYNFNHISFNDHYNYLESDILALNTNELIITTEKDYVKLCNRIQTQIFYLPIEFVVDNMGKFNNEILNSI